MLICYIDTQKRAPSKKKTSMKNYYSCFINTKSKMMKNISGFGGKYM